MDPAYVDFARFLWISVMDAKLLYAADHPGKSLQPATSAERELLERSLVGMAYRRYPRNRAGQFMVQG